MIPRSLKRAIDRAAALVTKSPGRAALTQEPKPSACRDASSSLASLGRPPSSLKSAAQRLRQRSMKPIGESMTKATVCTLPPMAAFEGIPRPQLRLIAYLVAKDLLGESIDDPVLIRRAKDLAESLSAVRKDVVFRANHLLEAEQTNQESALLNTISREAAAHVSTLGADYLTALGAAARQTHSGSCDDITSAVMSEHAGRLQGDDQIDQIVVVDTKKLEVIHDVNILRSASDVRQPGIVADGLTGGPQAPDTPVLETDWRFGGHRLSEPKTRVTPQTAPRRIKEYAVADEHIRRLLSDEGIDDLVAQERAQEAPLNPSAVWPSLPVFAVDFINKAGVAVSEKEQLDEAGLHSLVKAKAKQVLGRVPSDAVVDWLIDEAKHLERTSS